MHRQLQYLLVTHIPFARTADGGVVLDGLWSRDLEGLVNVIGPVRVAAPELGTHDSMPTWGPAAVTLPPDSGVSFVGLPYIASHKHALRWFKARAILSREVKQAGIVHTSNFFPPYAGLSYAHDLAVKSGKPTVFVIAEDFHDMLEWEWVRMATSPIDRWRRNSVLKRLDSRVRRSASTAAITFLHTPAAVERYRLYAKNGIAIRQPGHAAEDIISAERFSKKCHEILSGRPLKIVAASRHKPLKGLDLLIQAIRLLREWRTPISATLYGQGEATTELQRLSERLGVSDAVHFGGGLPPGAAIYDAIASGDLFAMPHRTTDFGRAFFDAMAGASPVIAFRTPAAQGTVDHGVDGLLCPLDDVEGLAAALQRCHQDRNFLVLAANNARDRAKRNTREAWYRLRAEWTHALLEP